MAKSDRVIFTAEIQTFCKKPDFLWITNLAQWILLNPPPDLIPTRTLRMINRKYFGDIVVQSKDDLEDFRAFAHCHDEEGDWWEV
jgi:hypothetical protein